MVGVAQLGERRARSRERQTGVWQDMLK